MFDSWIMLFFRQNLTDFVQWVSDYFLIKEILLMEKYILSIDQGTTSSRAILFNQNFRLMQELKTPLGLNVHLRIDRQQTHPL